MSNICLALAQTRKEILFIKKRIGNQKELTWLPVNLETLLFYVENEMNFINPSKYLNNDIHKEGINGSKKMIKKFKFEKGLEFFLKNRYIGVQRKYFNSCFFIDEILKAVKKKYSIKEIFVSGWKDYSFETPSGNYFLTQILINSIFKKRVVILENFKRVNIRKIHKFKIDSSNFNNKNFIFISNLGYNFKRIVFDLFKTNIKIVTFNQENLPWYKNLAYKVLGVRIINIKKSISNKKINIKIPKIKFKFKNKDYSNLIELRKNEVLDELQELKNLSQIIKNFLNKNKPQMILLNTLRGINGYLNEYSKQFNIPCLHISHGTLSNSKNKYCNSYNSVLSEELTTKKNGIFCIQSKIAKKFADHYRRNSINIVTGNLIFNKSECRNEGNILYAVTNRGFDSMHFFGIEMFYEYFQNLVFLNNFAKSLKNKKIYVKPHPTEFKSIPYLKKIFKNLIFTTQKNENLFKKIAVTISYSSTIIEDSLNSKIPVILFDQWKRYQHCDSEKNLSKKNSAIYYVRSPKNLETCVQTVEKSNNFNFQKFIYAKKETKNFKNLINNLNI